MTEEYNSILEIGLALQALEGLKDDADPAVATAAQEQLDQLTPDPSEFTRIRNAALNAGATRTRVTAVQMLGGIIQRMLHG